MHVNLIKVLKHMSDTDFQELSHNMNIAKKMRRIKHEFVLDVEDFADELNVQVPEVKNMMNGAYNFDIRMVSKIDVFENKLLEQEEVFEEEEEEVFAEEEETTQDSGAEQVDDENVFESDEPIKLNPDDDITLHPVEEEKKTEQPKKEESTSSDKGKSEQ